MLDQEDTRSPTRNAKFHAMVRDIARQVPWAGEKIGEEDWKRLILAGKYGQKVVPAPVGDGFVVMNNRRSRGLTNAEMDELLTELVVFGAEHEVEWTRDDDSN